MKLMMALDGRTYAGAPVDIVRKLRADAIHMKTRDIDAYMRAVVARLRAEEQADIGLEGDSLEERCEAFLIGSIRARKLLPVFQREHIDSTAIRVLRRARGLTQEQLAALLQVSFTTVNRWEAAGDRLSPNANTLESIDRQLFSYFWQPEEAPAPPRRVTTPLTEVLAGVRKRARESFTPLHEDASSTPHHKYS